MNRVEDSKTEILKKKKQNVKTLSEITSFSACALQFLLYFDLAFNYVSAIYKVSLLVRQNIGRMGNWRPDLLTLPRVPLKCLSSYIGASAQLFLI